MANLNGFEAAIDEDDSTARLDKAALVQGWREYAPRTPSSVPILKYAAKTDMGQVRENNEDKFDFYEPESLAVLAERGSLFAVADGIGGALAGQIASEMMLKRLVNDYYNHPSSEVETALREAISDTNSRVHSLAQMIPERNGMGTTLTAVIFQEDRVVIAQVGDSRAYLHRDGAIRQVSRDHSWVEEQVEAGMMSRADAETSPFRNVITRSIGAMPSVMPDLFVEDVCIGDVWILCSDGLTGHVEADEIAVIAANHAPSEACRQLIELANSRGGRDNITVFIIAVRDMLQAPEYIPSVLPFSLHNPLSISTSSVPSGESVSTLLSSQPDQVEHVSTADRTRIGWRKLFRSSD